MEEGRSIGMTVHHLSHMIRHRLEGLRGNDSGSTRYHGRIVCYLNNRRAEDVYQRDIEEEFGVRRSTATRLLQLMESNGLIVREPVSSDARLKKITITEKGIAFDAKVRGEIDRFETALAQSFTEEELEEFFRLTEKLRNTLSEMGSGENEQKERKDLP